MADFMTLAQQLNKELASEGVSLRFNGYIETWREYLSLNDGMLEDMFRLSNELLAWAMYFEEVLAWVEWRMRGEENKETYYKVFYDTFPVSHKDYARVFPQIKANYEQAHRLKVSLRLLVKHLTSQRKAFLRAHQDLTTLYLSQLGKGLVGLEQSTEEVN